MAKAIFGAGCFWSPEEQFRKVPGVTDVAVGYAGGAKENPTYEEVCTGNTGHAEVVEVEYDPEKVAYEDLLEVFFDIHDPTQVNRQGPDVGTQYRSAVFYEDAEQEAAARAVKEKLAARGVPVATEISKADTFWRAEEYHQQFLAKRRKGVSGNLFR
ncbi:peptide-methionine (S)-S-oxide reductase MsrA [Thalassobaculum litoreum]|uniref:Peptide methionine sulfoxide reductase MsrA n=1 Tax=Thalassobaculum litoreum DSM 18839 TaxID=1123362 RepID=A0A8G2BLZ0_9PROT|nr:peptide-methionine (S)-S-oxide reductase MsrA [Thalassobaculum litoreum]SDG47014.1 peptide-methionine (S)-S-oxide reductase [Thalassobaculum litoreum DSM 18839]